MTGDINGKQGHVNVIAKNIGGEASTECDLVIKGRAPTFIEKPIKCTVLEGDTAVFRCRVDGEPEPKVEWTKGKWRKMENNSTTRVFYDEEVKQYVLEMDNIKPKDAGTYTVTISNEYGSDSCPATLMSTNKEEDVEDWKAQLKKTIIQERVMEEEEIDWRSGLKVGVACLNYVNEARERGKTLKWFLKNAQIMIVQKHVVEGEI